MKLRTILATIALGFAATAAQAQDAWPARPIRIVHGFGSGGPVDLLARMLAPVLSERLGQPVLVEGKPGAGGTLGAAFVAKSDPDGYTLLLMAAGHSAAPGLYTSLPYDAANDFTMISMVARSPFAIIAGPASPAASMQELVQKARAQPGKIDFGSAGVGSGMHLVAVLLQARAGIQMTHVPYKTATAVNLAIISGEIPILFTSVAGITPLMESGKVKMLAVTGKDRYSLLPGVPTVAETILPDFDVMSWYALAAPKNLPAPVVAKLNEAVHAAQKRPEIIDRLRVQAIEVYPSTPREAQSLLASEVARWTKVVRDEKIPPQN
ncbi:MAG TPA: tripartite tricarboxylate transporter substrate binding protein [Burkholderiales bacterium]|nr:tripartite tricarboxylate transporter substrate binding protein [Burkholderiales bacterium]